MYDRLLIPVDGSDEADWAAMHGFELAREFGASVDVLHVVEGNALALARTAGEKERLRERGESILAEAAGLAAEVGVSVTTELAEGKPAVRIAEYATERNASLIVVGRQGLTGLGRRLLGGVTEQLLHRSDVPVLVVPGADRTDAPTIDYSRVLVPTDGSENAEAAVGHAATMAERLEAPLHVLYVVDLQTAGGPFNAGGLEREFVDRLEARGRGAVRDAAAEIGETTPGVAVETAVERTASFRGAAAGIREYVADHDVDLVVMGSHGRSNLERQLLGSVTSTLLRITDVPVLVVTRSSST